MDSNLKEKSDNKVKGECFINFLGNEISENSLSKLSNTSKDYKELTNEISLYVKTMKDDLINFSYSKSNSLNTIIEDAEGELNTQLDDKIKQIKKINELKDKSGKQTRLLNNPNKRMNNLIEEFINSKKDCKVNAESLEISDQKHQIQVKKESSSTAQKSLADSNQSFNWVNFPTKKQTLISNSYSSIKLDNSVFEGKQGISKEAEINSHFSNLNLSGGMAPQNSLINQNFQASNFNMMNNQVLGNNSNQMNSYNQYYYQNQIIPNPYTNCSMQPNYSDAYLLNNNYNNQLNFNMPITQYQLVNPHIYSTNQNVHTSNSVVPIHQKLINVNSNQTPNLMNIQARNQPSVTTSNKTIHNELSDQEPQQTETKPPKQKGKKSNEPKLEYEINLNAVSHRN